MDVIEFANRIIGTEGKDWRIKGDQLVTEYCPYCKGGDKGEDKYSFAINITNGVFNCMRLKQCGEKGNLNKLLYNFGIRTENKFGVKLHPVKSKKLLQYLEKRGISKETLTASGCLQYDDNTLAFPIYHNYELVNVKYRKINNDGTHTCWQISKDKGSKTAFIGIIDPSKPLLIVEGEIDYLTVREVGFRNVVSLPMGANNLDCLTIAWKELEKLSRIIIFTDKDEAGEKAFKELVNRLGVGRCSYVNSDYKDANDVLCNLGKDALINILKDHKQVPLPEIIQMSKVTSFDPTKLQRIKTGIKTLDSCTGGLVCGEVSIFTGKRGNGKSTFLNYVLANSIDQGIKSCIYSGELSNELLKYWVELSMVGSDHVEEIYIDDETPLVYKIKRETQKKVERWYQDQLIIYKNTNSRDPSKMLDKFEEIYKVYGTKLFIIDNWMTLDFTGSTDQILNKEKMFIQDCVDLASRYGIHIAIVLHPKKTDDKVTVDDIRGSGHITNAVHNVYIISRDAEKDEIDITIGKNRLFGQTKCIKVHYNNGCKRFYENISDLSKKYGWEKLEEEDRLL